MMTRFAGRVSAANYIAAGANAASQSSDMAAIARKNAPKYEEMAKESMAQDAKNFVQAEANKSQIAQRATAGRAQVAQTEMQIEANKKGLEAKRSVRKAGLVGQAAALGANALRKQPERKVNTIDTSYYDQRIAKLKGQAADLRGGMDDILNETYNPTERTNDADTPSPSSTQNNGEIISSAQAVAAGKGSSSKGGKYTQAQVTSFAEQAGFTPDQARTMGAIIMGESGGDAGIDTVKSGLDRNKSNEYSIGLSQINVQAHGDKLAKLGYTEDDLRDPVKNLQLAKLVHDEVGGFTPWSVYTKGIYKNYL